MRAARTPPEPPPMTNRSTSKSAISAPAAPARSDVLAALFHLGPELFVDGLGEHLCPLVHVGHAELDRARLNGEQFRAERGLVEGDEVLQLLLGELVGVDL